MLWRSPLSLSVLSGCGLQQAITPDGAEAECRGGQNEQVGEYSECRARVWWSWEFTSAGPDISNYFNPYQSVVSFDGSTVQLPPQGILRLEAFNSSGAMIGSHSQNWRLSGDQAVPADPQQITNWLNSTTANISRIEATMPCFQVGTTLGQNVFSTSHEYSGEIVAVAGSIFFAGDNCGSSPFLDPAACLQ